MHEIFRNQSIIVTGASFGIGRELALQFAEQGAMLTLAARSTDLLNEVADLCRQNGGKATAITTDVTRESQCKALIMRAIEEYGRIDTLVNNAGISYKSRFDEQESLSSVEMVIKVNFWGSVYCTYYALPYLKQIKGRIIVMNSVAGKFPATPAYFYCASKHALIGFFDTLRLELEGSGVTVSSIYPYWVATGISARALGSDGQPTGSVSSCEMRALSVQDCAKLILKAAKCRKREVFTTLKIKTAYVLRSIFPKFIDQLARNESESNITN